MKNKNINADVVFETKSNYDGEKIKLEWYDLVGRRIPKKEWRQVHIIANYNGKVVFVYFEKNKMTHIPGGHIESGEDIETAMRRELAEETGGLVLDWEPIGYQARIDSKGDVDYQLRVYAKVTGIKEKSVDYDGGIVSTNLVDINEMLKAWGWENPIGERIVDLVKEKFIKVDDGVNNLKKEAGELLKTVQPLLGKYGELEFVGSFAWGTMYDRDVDISVWMDNDKIKSSQQKIISSLLKCRNVYEIKTRDLISYNTDFKGGRNLKCILIMLKMFNDEGKLWNFDICLFDKADDNNNAMPFDKETLQKIETMSIEQRNLIIDIKRTVTDAGLYLKGRSSVDIYKKVIIEGVRTVAEYMPMAKNLAKAKVDNPKTRNK
ncbi:NUDIX domain-containing protein [bacterium]|nr:NUDIX domain-containing protein [bacterium]